MLLRTTLLALSLLLLLTPLASAQDPNADAAAEKPAADDATTQLFEKFEQTMHGAKLTGKFTVVGKAEKGLSEETYEILGVQKIEQGDYWIFKARVKYGDKDIVVPMPLEVKWAGDTPVITLTDTTIPGLGTFSARVVIHNDWYAGTWIHGKVGGHLFGTISREAAEPAKETE
jgi:hypothetical protein